MGVYGSLQEICVEEDTLTRHLPLPYRRCPTPVRNKSWIRCNPAELLQGDILERVLTKLSWQDLLASTQVIERWHATLSFLTKRLNSAGPGALAGGMLNGKNHAMK